jgi:WD40 repeat protein
LIGNTIITKEATFHSLQIIDSETAEVMHEFDGFPTYISSVQWNPDETQILSTDLNGVVRVTDVESGITTPILSSNQSVYSAVWSPYGGRIAVGVGLNATFKLEGQAISTSSVNSIPGLQIIVPDASLDRVKSIALRCNEVSTSNADTDALLSPESVSKLTDNDLSDFISQIKALPIDTIPPACAADLIAVAEALIDQ